MTDTSNINVTAEDRERLAKSKFGEWFDEFFEKKFEDAMKKHGSPAPKQQQQQQQTDGQQQETEQPKRSRRSLLETCLSDTFGF